MSIRNHLYAACGFDHLHTHTHTLSVRPQSGYFGGGGPGVGDMTDDAASDYLKRSAELNA